MPPETAPSVIGTTPANSASNVPLNSTIVISFSESVSASASGVRPAVPDGRPAAIHAERLARQLVHADAGVAAAVRDDLHGDGRGHPDHRHRRERPARSRWRRTSRFSFTTANPPPPGAGNVIINELDADTPVGIDTAEFVELYDGGVGNTPLDGLVVVFYNGNGDVSYAAFDLDGYTTNANGYFTLGNPGVPGVDLVFDPGAAGLLQNGADAVALYAGNASDFPNGTTVTTANLQDAVVYDTDDADDPGLLRAAESPDQPQVNENGGGSGTTQSSQRCPNGIGRRPQHVDLRAGHADARGPPTPACAPPTPSNSAIVISQLYGGGGNAGATYQQRLRRAVQPRHGHRRHRRLVAAVRVGVGQRLGLQQAAAGRHDRSGSSTYLIALASGGATARRCRPRNINGQINMSGTTGKVALVEQLRRRWSATARPRNPHLMDFVGYGQRRLPRRDDDGAGAEQHRRRSSAWAAGAPIPIRTAATS